MLTIPQEIVLGLGIVIPPADLKVLDLFEETADTAVAVEMEVEAEVEEEAEAAVAAAEVEVLLLDRTV